jgi:hypothetical protein
MPRARSNGLELEYDTFGDPAAAPMLLVMGLATQMIAWREELCRSLAGSSSEEFWSWPAWRS